jgi:hypothetical protein
MLPQFSRSAQMLLLCFGVGVWLTATEVYGETADEVGPDGAVVTIDQEEFDRLPVRTIEDWLALQPGVIVPYPGSRSFFVRGARQYNNAFLLNGAKIEDPATGQLLASFSPYTIGGARLDQTASSAHDALGGLVTLVSPHANDRIAGLVEITSDNFGSGYDQNWYDIALSGPLSRQRQVSFTVAAERRYLGDRRPSPITERVSPDGGKRLRGNSLKGWSGHGSVTWKVSDKSEFLFWSDCSQDTYQTYDHRFYYFPRHMPKTQDRFADLGAKLYNRISERTQLTVTASVSYNRRIMGDGVAFDDLDAYPTYQTNNVFDEYRLFRVVDSTGTEPYFGYFVSNDAISIDLSGDIQTRLTGHHLLTITPSLYFCDASRSDNYSHKRLGKISAAIGDAARFGTFRFQPLLDVSLYAHSIGSPIGFTYDGVTPNVSVEQDPLGQNSGFSRSYFRLSPSFRASVGLSKLQISATAGLAHDLPPLFAVFATPIWSTGLEPERVWFAEVTVQSPSGKHVTWEFTGYAREFADQTLDGTRGGGPYYISWKNDPRQYLTLSPSFGQWGETRSFGLAARVSAALSTSLSLSTGYAICATESNVAGVDRSGSPDQDYTYYIRYISDVPASYDQTHKFVGVADLHTDPGEGPSLGRWRPLADLSAVTTLYVASGFRYTPNTGDQVAVNSARQPAVVQIDMRIEKTVRLAGYRLVPFLWVRNLLDRANATSVYPTTGKPDNSGVLDTPGGQAIADSDPVFYEQYSLYQQNPANFAPPRQIYFGVRAEF